MSILFSLCFNCPVCNLVQFISLVRRTTALFLTSTAAECILWESCSPFRYRIIACRKSICPRHLVWIKRDFHVTDFWRKCLLKVGKQYESERSLHYAAACDCHVGRSAKLLWLRDLWQVYWIYIECPELISIEWKMQARHMSWFQTSPQLFIHRWSLYRTFLFILTSACSRVFWHCMFDFYDLWIPIYLNGGGQFKAQFLPIGSTAS